MAMLVAGQTSFVLLASRTPSSSQWLEWFQAVVTLEGDGSGSTTGLNMQRTVSGSEVRKSPYMVTTVPLPTLAGPFVGVTELTAPTREELVMVAVELFVRAALRVEVKAAALDPVPESTMVTVTGVPASNERLAGECTGCASVCMAPLRHSTAEDAPLCNDDSAESSDGEGAGGCCPVGEWKCTGGLPCRRRTSFTDWRLSTRCMDAARRVLPSLIRSTDTPMRAASAMRTSVSLYPFSKVQSSDMITSLLRYSNVFQDAA
mmetsp:Transcript_13413/g.30839  ORF Transcript_13413/g.30839 Transcript_13413/m.30839 type:complete len:261 (+) Transcript_13413:275-1057(+)